MLKFLMISSLILRAPEPAEGGGGGSGAPAPTQQESAKGKTFTQEEVNAIVAREKGEALTKGQKAVFAKLKEAGFDVDDEGKLVEMVKSGEEARKAKQSEIERASEEAKTAAKQARESAEALKAQTDENKKLRALIEAKPVDPELFEALYDKASKADGFDASKWITEQKEKRPALFDAAAAAAPKAGENGAPPKAPASTTTNAGAGTQPSGSNGARVDASKMNAEELRAYEASIGIGR
jgi:hypothetical protein